MSKNGYAGAASIQLFWFAALIALQSLTAMAEIVDSRMLQASPLEDWRTIETSHFNIHFRENDRKYATRLAQIAEYHYLRLTRSLQWTPVGKTEIVVNDSVDFSNGAATIYPYNQIFVYLNEPVSGQLQDRMDFMETLFLHEYTHILHLDQAEGFPAIVRQLFGKAPQSLFTVLALPQVFAPHWLSEGIAVYQESATGYGRNHSAQFEAMMREEVRKGLAGFTEESYEGYYGSRWPLGQVYLYGAYFFQFLETQYGKKTLQNYVYQYNRNIVPWRMNKRARLATGNDAKTLWMEFQDYLHKRFDAEILATTKAGVTDADIKYTRPWINRLLTPGPDGSVFFYADNLKNTPAIIQLFADGQFNVVSRIKGVTNLRWHETAGLLISRPGVCGSRALFSDLYRLGLQSGSLQRITHCARLDRADWEPDGSSIVAVQTEGGLNRLVRVSLNGKVRILAQLNLGESIGHPRVMPDGSIVATVKRRGQGWGLEAFYPIEARWLNIIRDNSIVSAVEIGGINGEDFLFVSDHEGRVELRRIGANDKRIQTLTRSQGFVYQGVAASDGAIWYSQYTGGGDVIKRIAPGDEFSEPLASDMQQFTPVRDFVSSSQFQADRQFTEKPYSAWPSLRPRGWSPVYFSDGEQYQYGFQLMGSDALGFHDWNALPLYYSIEDESLFGGVLAYSFDDRISFLLSREQIGQSASDESNGVLYHGKQDHAQLLLHYPINNIDWSADFFLGLAGEKNQRTLIPDNSNLRTRDTISGVGMSFNNFALYPHAITRGSGFAFDLIAETFDAFGFRSDHKGEAFLLKSSGNIRFGENQTLIASINAGTGDKDGKPFMLGDTKDAVNELGGITRLGQREFAFRGYSKNPQLTGSSFFHSAIAWHFPLHKIYDGWVAPPIGLGQLQANVFAESGDAWDDKRSRAFYHSIGAELRVEFLIGYDSLNLPVTFGAASGLDGSLGEDVFYLGLDLTL